VGAIPEANADSSFRDLHHNIEEESDLQFIRLTVSALFLGLSAVGRSRPQGQIECFQRVEPGKSVHANAATYSSSTF